MQTRFTKDQVVRSSVTAQGMTKGALYRVVDVDVNHTPVGGFTHYHLQPLAGGATLVVGNGHLLLSEVDEQTLPVSKAVVRKALQRARTAPLSELFVAPPTRGGK